MIYYIHWMGFYQQQVLPPYFIFRVGSESGNREDINV